MIQLNYRDAKPIYEQIKDGLKRLIITGALAKDEKIPSVRELASSLAINPNTIQRAYRELEAEGYIYTVSGRGSFACDKTEIKDGRSEKLYEQFDELVREILYITEDTEALKKRIDEISKGGESDDQDK